MRKSKEFGIALVVALALSSVIVPVALATYDSEVSSTTLDGQQVSQVVFTSDVGNLKCATATFEGSMAGVEKASGIYTSSSFRLHPVFGTCNLAGQAVTVTTTECEYEFGAASSKKASVTIVCVKEIIVKDKAGLGCELKTKGQSPGGTVSYTNSGSGDDRVVEITWGVTGVSYSWTAGCPNAKGKAGSNTNGTYTGSVKVEGNRFIIDDIGIWVT